jgi:hypothetical protein
MLTRVGGKNGRNCVCYYCVHYCVIQNNTSTIDQYYYERYQVKCYTNKSHFSSSPEYHLALTVACYTPL